MVWVGRLQPFHMGHLATLKRSLDLHGDPHISCIVNRMMTSTSESTGKHGIHYNPFTSWERYAMAKSCLVAEEIESRVDLMCVPQFPVPEWGRILEFLPQNTIRCATNRNSEEFKRVELWKSLGWRTAVLDVSKMEVQSSSQMRAAMLRDEDWKPFLHEAIHSFFVDIDGPARMLNAAIGLQKAQETS